MTPLSLDASQPALVFAKLQKNPPKTGEYDWPPSEDRNSAMSVATRTASEAPDVSTATSCTVLAPTSDTKGDHVFPSSVLLIMPPVRIGMKVNGSPSPTYSV